jgi:hypothetical protein
MPFPRAATIAAAISSRMLLFTATSFVGWNVLRLSH